VIGDDAVEAVCPPSALTPVEFFAGRDQVHEQVGVVVE
jgi:hypothetical protein